MISRNNFQQPLTYIAEQLWGYGEEPFYHARRILEGVEMTKFVPDHAKNFYVTKKFPFPMVIMVY